MRRPSSGWLKSMGATDIDGDGSVGFSDFLKLAAAFGSSEGVAGYDPASDLDGNGQIGFSDFLILAAQFGT